MKTLPIDKIILEDSFLKENDDILPNGCIWFYNIIKNGIKKEDRTYEPNRWFLFNKEGDYILEYIEYNGNVWLNFDKILRPLKNQFMLDDDKIHILLNNILEKKFNCKSNRFLIERGYNISFLERHFYTL